jgi:hypothetical protein
MRFSLSLCNYTARRFRAQTAGCSIGDLRITQNKNGRSHSVITHTPSIECPSCLNKLGKLLYTKREMCYSSLHSAKKKKEFNVLSCYVTVGLQNIHSLKELSPSWEAANCAAAQELPSILWNPVVHYRVHNSPPPVPIPSQINLILVYYKIFYTTSVLSTDGLLCTWHCVSQITSWIRHTSRVRKLVCV